MSVTTQGVMTSYPGTDSGYYREAHLEWPRGGWTTGVHQGPGDGDLTVSLWANLAVQTNVLAAFFAINAMDGSNPVFVGTDESGYLFAYGVSGRMYQPYQAPPVTLAWHHYGFRRTGQLNEVFIDGALFAQLYAMPPPVMFDRITLFGATAWAQFVGSLAAVKVFSRALTQTELIAEGRSQAVVSPLGLFACWPLASINDYTDHSGNHRDLVPSSGFFATGPAPPFSTLAVKPPNLPQPLPPQPPYG